MQANNKFRPYSSEAESIYTDDEVTGLASNIVSAGAITNQSAGSDLYNSLSLQCSILTTAITDFIASQNPTLTFGLKTLTMDAWIQAVQNTFAPKASTDTSISTINTTLTALQDDIADIVDGSTTTGNAMFASNANVTNLNENENATVNFQIGDGTAYNKTINNVQNATNAVNAENATKATKLVTTTVAPTQAAEEGTLVVFTGTQLPTTRFDNILYIITYD